MSDVGERLKDLARRHAELSSDIKINSERRIIELGYCKGAQDGDGKYYESCYEMVYSMTGESMEHREGISFDEMLFNYGCRHCCAARDLKKHIGRLKQERGRIHSALTNIGKTL